MAGCDVFLRLRLDNVTRSLCINESDIRTHNATQSNISASFGMSGTQRLTTFAAHT